MKLIFCAFVAMTLPFIYTPSEDNLPINKIQVIGSHNSYKQSIDPALFNIFRQKDSASAYRLDYGHIGLAEQLELGLRNMELDVYADSNGGKFAHPKGLIWAPGQVVYDPSHEMEKPGFKMLHVPDLDFRSSALTLKAGLQKLRKWSDAHPSHTPVFITLEPKDGAPETEGLTIPEKFTPQLFDELDQLLRTELGDNHLLTPDQVRGKYQTLEEAVWHGNWPTVKAARGKFAFILDTKGEKMQLYIQGHPSLKGRVLFVNADAGTPEAAMMIRNNAKDSEIPSLVKKGYIIRTRADADTEQARRNDRSYFNAACASGAQIITTDYYQKSTHFPSDYTVSFVGSTYFRTNPFWKGETAKK